MVFKRKKKEEKKLEEQPIEVQNTPAESQEEHQTSGAQMIISDSGTTDSIYTFLVISSIAAYIFTIILAGMEAHDFYDVAFFFFKKQ
ncbi:MAG: hypothetical protein HY606_12020 [Planctomycetes bacterium]|nr:hypothetical protein [Planctomycetota bacterium]